MITSCEKENLKHNIDIIKHSIKKYTTLQVKNIVEISDIDDICLEYLADGFFVKNEDTLYLSTSELDRISVIPNRFSTLDLLKIDSSGKTWKILNLLGNYLDNVHSIHVKCSHDVSETEKIFEDVEEFLKVKGFIILDIARYRGYSYSVWIKPEYLNNDRKSQSSAKISIISSLSQLWLNSGNLSRKFIENYLVKLFKKKYRNKFLDNIHQFKSIKCENGDEEKFLLIASRDDMHSGQFENIGLAPSPHLLKQAFCDIQIDKSWVLLDAGCGTGYVLYKLHNQFKNVYGYELNSELCKIARSNLKQVGVKNFEIFNKNINEIDIEFLTNINVFYLYNPFIGETFKNFIKKIVKSIELKDRPVYIVYANSTYRNTVLRYNKIFNLVKTSEQLNYSIDVFYHEKHITQ